MRATRGPRVLASLALLALAACRRDAPARGDANATNAPENAANSVNRSWVTQRATFALAHTEVTIEDAAMTNRFDAILTRAGAEAVVNGGFFGVDTRPDGLAIAHGKRLAAFSPSMSGGVLWIQGGLAHLTATEEYDAGVVDFAVQCRPRLVVASRVNIKHDDGKRARRTALCVRDGGKTLEIDVALESGAVDHEQAPTLFELATELAARGCEEALNLDGGPSTGFAFRADGGIASAPSRGPVRHAIVVRAAQ